MHELTPDVNTGMKCVAKIMAMPGTRTAVADLCMFGWLRDEGGPGFVNASVRDVSRCGCEVNARARIDTLRPTRTTQSRDQTGT